MFSSEKVNTGRQVELDIARGLAVLFMIFIHAQENLANQAVQESLFGQFNDFVGTVPAAPVFMFLMGLGIVYSRKNDPATYYKRGALLFLSGFILNVLCGFLPNLVQAFLSPQSSQTFLTQAIMNLFEIDILPFAGLAMITFGLIKQFNLKNYHVAFLALGFGLLNFLISPLVPSNPILATFLGLFWGTNSLSYFPFLSWIFYPLVGYLFGNLLIRCTNKNRFYRLVAASSILFYSLLFPSFLSFLQCSETPAWII
ncbi:heparan-alpha-glucosaminide N-acetyltransferase domain-containing protein [Streptococcus oricebi]|uniref:Heparan-alpha-glucosaminide N-acetyltransferase catalytic domain-containing protein n=1 Tax=Streptococcus oricebi TaxID=1547447 RepID=A0ABS5B1R6_9STRE|nr:heparan-alpha-glucosaminide N-acetyltransferase domain-containing protein [Streptococcus oricebi]MBP2622765.1 hypothetical protein [Streptococcus oricebi]